MGDDNGHYLLGFRNDLLVDEIIGERGCGTFKIIRGYEVYDIVLVLLLLILVTTPILILDL